MTWLLSLLVLMGVAVLGLTSNARAADAPTLAIPANFNDAGIDPAKQAAMNAALATRPDAIRRCPLRWLCERMFFMLSRARCGYVWCRSAPRP